MPVIVGMDVATRTGIAVGEPGSCPLAWSVLLGDAGSDHSIRFAQALRTTHKLIKEYNPTLIAIEAPIKQRMDKTSTNLLLMGLVACIQGMAHDKGVRTTMVSVSTLDKHFVGRRMKGRDERKRAIWQTAKMLGWKPPDQDAADACAVWSWACSSISNIHASQTTPLFRHGH